MQRHRALAPLALLVALAMQAGPKPSSGEAGAMRVSIEAVDSTRTVIVRLEAHGSRVHFASSTGLTLSGDTLRVSTPAMLELMGDPGQLALVSEASGELRVDASPLSGARVPHLAGTGTRITLTRKQREGPLVLSTN